MKLSRWKNAFNAANNFSKQHYRIGAPLFAGALAAGMAAPFWYYCNQKEGINKNNTEPTNPIQSQSKTKEIFFELYAKHPTTMQAVTEGGALSLATLFSVYTVGSPAQNIMVYAQSNKVPFNTAVRAVSGNGLSGIYAAHGKTVMKKGAYLVGGGMPGTFVYNNIDSILPESLQGGISRPILAGATSNFAEFLANVYPGKVELKEKYAQALGNATAEQKAKFVPMGEVVNWNSAKTLGPLIALRNSSWFVAYGLRARHERKDIPDAQKHIEKVATPFVIGAASTIAENNINVTNARLRQNPAEAQEGAVKNALKSHKEIVATLGKQGLINGWQGRAAFIAGSIFYMNLFSGEAKKIGKEAKSFAETVKAQRENSAREIS